jgi:alpha-tubulin suppressor-like RCC1 family protein
MLLALLAAVTGDASIVISHVTSGLGFTVCAVQANGVVFCFGRGISGQLGNGGAQVNSGQPVAVIVPATSAVCTGLNFSCFLLTDNTVYCTGANWYGQVGPICIYVAI